MTLSETNTKESKLPLNFKTVNKKFTADDVLNAYSDGKDALKNQIKDSLNNGLQISSMSSNYLFEKLKNKGVEIVSMYLRILNFNEFDSLVVVKDPDYYDKTKRWDIYAIAKEINSGIDSIDLNFSFMPESDQIDDELISSEGFVFEYDK